MGRERGLAFPPPSGSCGKLQAVTLTGREKYVPWGGIGPKRARVGSLEASLAGQRPLLSKANRWQVENANIQCRLEERYFSFVIIKEMQVEAR